MDRPRRRARSSFLARLLKQPRMRLGLALATPVFLLAIFGPMFAPHSPSDLLGTPFSPSSSAAPLGTDYLGEDVLSRLMAGGRSVVWMAFLATVFGVGMGAIIGLVAGYSKGRLDNLLMRAMDVFLAFPAIVLVLLFVSMLGPKLWMISLLVGLAWMPQVARVIRGATVEAVTQDYVEAAEVIGVPRREIIFNEVLPNIVTPLTVEFGLRLTWSIGTIAAISFLGQGMQPPGADWGLMIDQNREGLTLQPWGVLGPVILIGLFTFGTNLMTEGIARASAGGSGGSAT